MPKFIQICEEMGLDHTDFVMASGAKRKMDEDDNNMNGIEMLLVAKPPVIEGDPDCMIAAMRVNPIGTMDAFGLWVGSLSMDNKKALHQELEEAARSGNVNFLTNTLVKYMVEHVNLSQMMQRMKIIQNYLKACMMKSIKSNKINQNKILTTLSTMIR